MKPAERLFFRTRPKRPRSFTPSSAAPAAPFLTLASAPPGPAHKLIAAVTAAILVAAFLLAVGPLGRLRLAEIDAFSPACGAAMFVAGAITAALFFVQFAITRLRALLLIAGAYLFAALIAIPWLLANQGGGFGANPQAASWLSVFWLAGFPLIVVAYALLGATDPQARVPRHPGLMIGGAVCLVIAVVVTMTLLATHGATEIHPGIAWHDVAGAAALLAILALATLGYRLNAVLDLWLMVVMCAYLLQTLLVSFPMPARFTAGWYGGYCFGLFAAGLMLIVLLFEIAALYARLRDALRAQGREREARLLTGSVVAAMIAHDIKQPLAGITAHAQAGLLWLDRPAPALEQARDALRHIATHGLRTGQMIDNARATFRRDAPTPVLLNPDDLIADVLAGLRADLDDRHIDVRTASDPDLPAIFGDPGQLHQCLANLVINAIEAMAHIPGPRILSIDAAFRDGGVRISVADNGPGIHAEDAGRIFNPLFTSKPCGVGMGLAICRAIIDGHGGKLWVAPNPPRGAIFHVDLRIAEA